jgi:hypothetical protein
VGAAAALLRRGAGGPGGAAALANAQDRYGWTPLHLAVKRGLGCIVYLYYRSSVLYQIHEYRRNLYF